MYDMRGPRAHVLLRRTPSGTIVRAEEHILQQSRQLATSETVAGQTEHFVVYTDGTADGDAAAQAVLASCESDFSAVQACFGGISLPPGQDGDDQTTPRTAQPIYVLMDPNAGGAYHYACNATDLYIEPAPADQAPGLVVAELVEVFEAAINNGWQCGQTNGEALSRVLAVERDASLAAITVPTEQSWWADGAQDYVNDNSATDQDEDGNGCGTLFLYYLNSQLGFSWAQIVAAGGNTLGDTYQTLTGNDPTQGFSDFVNLLSTLDQGGQLDLPGSGNPFPIQGASSSTGSDQPAQVDQGVVVEELDVLVLPSDELAGSGIGRMPEETLSGAGGAWQGATSTQSAEAPSFNAPTSGSQLRAHVLLRPTPSGSLVRAEQHAFQQSRRLSTSETVAGQTQHFVVYTDGTADGNAAAQAVLAACEADYAAVQAWFGGINLPAGQNGDDQTTPRTATPMYVLMDPNAGGAYHYACNATDLYIEPAPANQASGLVVAEEVEVFEAAINNGWNCGQTNGEALSRVLAVERNGNLAPLIAQTAQGWWANGQQDYVNDNSADDQNQDANGCGSLFLYYLHSQLGYSWTQIVTAGGSTLGATYQKLTGKDPTQGFSDFVNLLSSQAQGGQLNLPSSGNPFPVGQAGQPAPAPGGTTSGGAPVPSGSGAAGGAAPAGTGSKVAVGVLIAVVVIAAVIVTVAIINGSLPI